MHTIILTWLKQQYQQQNNNEMILDDILLYSDWCLVQWSLEKLSPAADVSRHRDPQLDIMQI